MNFATGIIIFITWNVLNSVNTSSVPRSEYGELKLFLAPATYSVDTTVLLNDATRRDKEIGYKIKASLDLTPIWNNGHSEFLLKFDLLSPVLHSRGTHISADFVAQSSLWDAFSHSTFYAHWKNGLIETAYLDKSDPEDVLNYKKSLISLFQFQVIDGEHNETDISGTCQVMYETISMHTIRKIKSACGTEASTGEEPGVESRRLHRYSLSGALDALDELYAEELHTLGDARAAFALKARAWQRLARSPSAPAPAPAPAASLAAALAALPAALAPHALPLRLPEPSFLDDDDEEAAGTAAAAWAAAREALRGEAAGAGGGAAAAAAALRLLPALRRAARRDLATLLHAERDPDLLASLCRLLGLAGGADTHAAATAFLHLRDADPLDALARVYLAALALAPHPHEDVVMEVARLGEGAWGGGAGALLAAAAAAPRASPRAELAVRDSLLKGLARCKDEECSARRLEALGNLRRADTVEPLLSAAEGGRPRVALAALHALRALPAAALLSAARLHRLERVALGPAPFDVRAAALDLLVQRSAPAPLQLERLAHALHDAAAAARDAGAEELRRVFWQRLRALAPHHAAVRLLLRLLPPRLTAWHAHPVPGTSSVLEREVRGAGGRGAAGGRRAVLSSVQLARGGLLRRGRVALLALDARNDTDEAVAVELWTRGLETLAGGAAGAGETTESEEEVAGGLVLTVGGARLPAVALFDGQAELLGHVWAGRGSEPTAVVRALRPLRLLAGALPLAAGAALRWDVRAALELALDAQAQVSLWSRSARAQLELRAGLHAACEARVGSALRGRVTLDAEPRLRIAADLDFYDGVALCVRAATAPHERRQRAELRAGAGEPPRRVRRTRELRWTEAGRTLALGAPNDVACRTLGSADD